MQVLARLQLIFVLKNTARSHEQYFVTERLGEAPFEVRKASSITYVIFRHTSGVQSNNNRYHISSLLFNPDAILTVPEPDQESIVPFVAMEVRRAHLKIFLYQVRHLLHCHLAYASITIGSRYFILQGCPKTRLADRFP